MFHLLIGLFALGYSAVVLWLLCLPLFLGPLVQAFLTIFVRKKALQYIPVILGLAGGFGYWRLMGEALGIWPILGFWAIYYSLILCAFLLARWVREKIQGVRKK